MWQILRSLKPQVIPNAKDALKGRTEEIESGELHAVTGRPLKGPLPDQMERVVVGMGCFWGAERLFWQTEGVYSTAVGYAGGHTPNPTYQEVCSGQTGHTEVVEVIYDPSSVNFSTLLMLFWERHNPTQGMRQGNDVGTQYRSALFWTTEAQRELIEKSRADFETLLLARGLGEITTELSKMPVFYYAEEYHQQYLHKNPNGYCGLQGAGVKCGLA